MNKTKPLPLLDYLNECLELSEESSSGLVWKLRPRSHFNTDRGYNQIGKGYAGKQAGSIFTQNTGKQYWSLQVGNRSCYCHRVVYSIFNSIELSLDIQIDHIDGNGLNNSPQNLRQAHACENSHNSKMNKNNLSGFKGVGWCRTNENWRGRVMYKGKVFYAKGCQTPEEASIHAENLRNSLHKEFANHGN